jgi:biofilm PGA synthesis N-glycosyltransferase PgaC
MIPGSLPLVPIVLACGIAVPVLLALPVWLLLARRRRTDGGEHTHVDPDTGLRSAASLARDLRELSHKGPEGGTHLLALLEPPTAPGSSKAGEQGPRDDGGGEEERTRRLARRLTNAVGRAGSAYVLDEGRFGVLARVGRGSERAFLSAATAAVSDLGDHAGVNASATVAALTVSAQSTTPRDALRWLVSESGPAEAMLFESESREFGTDALGAAHADAGGALSATSQAPATAATASDTLTAATMLEPLEIAGTALSPDELESALREPHASPTAPGRAPHRFAPRRPVHEGPHFPHRTRESHLPARPLSSEAVRAARRRDREPRNPPPRFMPYLRVTTRFKISVCCGVVWMGISTWVAWPWIEDLSHSITLPLAFLLILGIALIPGYLNVQLVTSLLMDHPAPIDFDFTYPALTLLTAVYNEEADVAQTIAYALDQEYPAPLEIVVIDDGSSDETVNIAKGFARVDSRVRVLEVPHGGKARALNAGLATATTPLVATIDADTLLMPDALRRVVSRMLLAPDDTVAVAGSVMVRNSRESLIAAAQTWDYFLGIGSIKREQALLQGTLVAQGAFSVYDTEALKTSGGWPDCIGEDIVMTWALLARGGRTSYEPTAIAFTEAPVTLRTFARQRRRWARGMIEGLRTHGKDLLCQRRPYAHSVVTDIVFPFLDVAFTIGFIPGLVLAAIGNYAIVGLMTLAVLPLNVLISTIMYRRQRRSFQHAGLRVRQHAVGFVVYLLCFQLIMSPVSVAGYLQEIFHATRRW